MKYDWTRLRRMLGILGMLLPFVDIIFGFAFGVNNPAGWYNSISATHYANSYLLFEGLMVAVGLFLIVYYGYDKKENLLTSAIGFGGIALAFFPCTLSGAEVRNIMMLPMKVTNIIHLTGALIFFLGLVYLIGFCFTKSDHIYKQKARRNKVYVSCAIGMAASLAIGFGLNSFGILSNIVWWGEMFALEFFGVAWYVKGEGIKALNDIEDVK